MSNAKNSKENYSLNHEAYFKSPREYLSQLDSVKIGSDLLVDRYLHEGEVFKTNGTSKVTVIDYHNFYNIYQTIKYSLQDSGAIEKFDNLLSTARGKYNSEDINLISVLDFSFKSIDSLAVNNNEFVQMNDYLADDLASSESYLNNRVVAFSCFKYNLYGEKIKFLIPEEFFLKNQDSLQIININVDFGNGEGYKSVAIGSPITVNYSGGSEYLEMKLQLEYVNIHTDEESKVFAHTSVFRKGSTVPEASKLIDVEEVSTRVERKTTEVVPYTTRFLYPQQISQGDYHPYQLVVTILFNENNRTGTSRKLRKPLIMVDGFDPGNKRDYVQTIKDDPDALLPKEKDLRGLYEVLDGQLSPWDKLDAYDNSIANPRSKANMVSALRSHGFDIVIVNFTNGAGDINRNAESIRALLNNVINTSRFRDNKTEEAVLIGPSMGGVITRMALAEMEHAGEEHFVKSWISFDSPHTGANIPIGLQFTMNRMARTRVPEIRTPALKPMESMNSVAARQLFHHHHESSQSGSFIKDALGTELLRKLQQLQYPKVSKNYSITNGSQYIQYSNSVSEIGDLYVLKYGQPVLECYVRTQVSSVPSMVNIVAENVVNFQSGSAAVLRIDNAPGGWHGGMYSFNRAEGSERIKYDVQYEKASFIPTTSAFGIALTPNSVQKTWGEYSSLSENDSRAKTVVPFDEILGMSGKNQEHIAITVETRNSIMNWFNKEFENTARPVRRSDASGSWAFANESINQTASKPVAYMAEFNISFGGGDNTFTFKDGADANIVSGKTIEFLPGFKTSDGVKMVARIEEVKKGKVLRKGQVTEYVSSTETSFTEASPIIDKVYNYDATTVENNNTKKKSAEAITVIQIGPNPVIDFLTINVEGINSTSIVELFNMVGELVFSRMMLKTQLKIDFSQLSSGFYLVKVSTSEEVYQQKIVKK